MVKVRFFVGIYIIYICIMYGIRQYRPLDVDNSNGKS
jgi:hypothetical protein